MRIKNLCSITITITNTKHAFFDYDYDYNYRDWFFVDYNYNYNYDYKINFLQFCMYVCLFYSQIMKNTIHSFYLKNYTK